MTSLYTVEVVTTSGVALPVLMHSGVRYVVAEAGVEFEVKVKLTNATGDEHKIRLLIDGADVGYSKIMHGQHTTSEAIFRGFLQSQGTGSSATLYRAFKFGQCKPSNDAHTVDHPDEIKAGRIEVECDVVVVTGATDPNIPVKPTRLGDEASKLKLPEGKKWFLAPGLQAEAGKTVASTTRWDFNQYTAVSTLPPIRLRYDTAENLWLRKILNPANPAHKAILRTSPNQRVAALGMSADEASSRQRAAGVKREGAAAGVKRERGEADGAVPQSASAVTMDLTGDMPTGPLMVGGRAVGADELAVCDLCDSDDEPDWQVQKKQAIELAPEEGAD